MIDLITGKWLVLLLSLVVPTSHDTYYDWGQIHKVETVSLYVHELIVYPKGDLVYRTKYNDKIIFQQRIW